MILLRLFFKISFSKTNFKGCFLYINFVPFLYFSLIYLFIQLVFIKQIKGCIIEDKGIQDIEFCSKELVSQLEVLRHCINNRCPTYHAVLQSYKLFSHNSVGQHLGFRCRQSCFLPRLLSFAWRQRFTLSSRVVFSLCLYPILLLLAYQSYWIRGCSTEL